MHFSHIAIKNFRALQNVECDLSPHMNVIVGPNGVGKSSILQALRLTKALLAPRTTSEAQQTLISLAAASPHFPQRLFLGGLANDASNPIDLRWTIVFSDAELATLAQSTAQIAQNVAASRAGQPFSNPAALIQFLQSQFGSNLLKEVRSQLDGWLKAVREVGGATLGMTINPQLGQIQAIDPITGPMIAHLDQAQPPALSMFSYFPADRALPMGEVQIQLGGPDTSQQLEAHNSQPQLKFARLKNLIINSLVVDGSGDEIKATFEKIFDGLLRGRRIDKIRVNEVGLLQVMTQDAATGRLIELDSLSSGEKNIAITFLLIARSLAKGGVVLFDEPELHLNPAVCKDVLPFMSEQYGAGQDLQFIICTHSPEILSSAFSRDDCTLLHLLTPTNISKVGKNALDECAVAFQKLGTSVAETLFYRGTILVEGPTDRDMLESMFPALARRYSIKEKGGKNEVLKSLKTLQQASRRGDDVSPVYVIFDRDQDAGDVTAEGPVGVLRWSKYCLDNYLIDTDILAELLKDEVITKSPMSSEGDVQKLVRDIAFEQLDEVAARAIYSKRAYESPGLRREDVEGMSLAGITAKLFERVDRARSSLPSDGREGWERKFVSDVEAEKTQIASTWQVRWRDSCDGKRLISTLAKRARLNVSESRFRTLVAEKMRDRRSENWTILRNALEKLLGTTDF
jgi:ABC-type molybdenum transport system ATPase subunit/photorepair protein PhrA